MVNSFFFEWRTNLYGKYKNLFNSAEAYDHFTEEELTEMEANSEKSKTNKWLTIVDKLAKGDITKHNEVYNINYIHALNMLGHWKQTDEQKK